LELSFAENSADELMYGLDWALLGYDALIVSADRAGAVRNGKGWLASTKASDRSVGDKRPVRVYSPEGAIVAMAEYDDSADRWQPQKVF
jgi:tRNA U55 pseudouridine synthase TruB